MLVKRKCNGHSATMVVYEEMQGSSCNYCCAQIEYGMVLARTQIDCKNHSWLCHGSLLLLACWSILCIRNPVSKGGGQHSADHLGVVEGMISTGDGPTACHKFVDTKNGRKVGMFKD